MGPSTSSMAAEPTVIRGACPHDCPDTCAWEVTVRDGVAEKLVGVKDHPFTRGGLCAKVSHFLERTYSPDRLRQPLLRTGPKGSGAFEPVAWDVALAHIAERLRAVVDEHGGEAVLPYSFAGTQGLVQGASMDRRFFARLGACRLERTICGQAAAAGQLEAAGTLVGMRPFDLLHSRFIVLWGTNTIVTNLHQWPIVQQARKAGARVVVIDPLLTRTAAAADWHVRPLPGTDAALALGLMHVIVAEDLHDAEYVAKHTEGFERLAGELAAWSPARTQEVTGVAADEVVALARAYATTRPAAIRRLIGIEHHREGARMVRTISCLPALVGAWRERGGGILGPTSWAAYSPLDQDALAGPQPDTRAVNMVRLGHALTELDPPVHALVVYNSNPATTAPDSTRVMQGLARDDLFTVVLEHFLTDTARYADVVLPATTQVEHVDIVPSWGTRTSPTTSRPSRPSARRSPTPRSSGAWRARWASTARPSRPPTRSSRGRRSPAPGRRWTRSTSSACARWGGRRPTSPRTSGRSPRAASGRRPGAFACGPTGWRPASTRRRATTSRWRS